MCARGTTEQLCVEPKSKIKDKKKKIAIQIKNPSQIRIEN
jgi:hypothetical protein